MTIKNYSSQIFVDFSKCLNCTQLGEFHDTRLPFVFFDNILSINIVYQFFVIFKIFILCKHMHINSYLKFLNLLFHNKSVVTYTSLNLLVISMVISITIL